jgi:NAD(P)-dependent dehydrogenase (short-subunit alcohol dehydrogenase family)
MNNSLKGKVAIVTGAGSGIGKAIAELYAREGARVVVSDINEIHGNEVAEAIKAEGGEALFVMADSSKPEDNERLVQEAVSRFGGLHIAVNNAGIGGPLSPTGAYPVDGWDKVIAINLSGVFYGMRYQIPAMLQSGEGSIINVASILGATGTKGSPAYVAAKHGVVGLTKASALEYARQNIRVNAIGPGYIQTPLVMNALDADTIKMLEGLHAMGRLGKSEEVAELALFLASAKASFVTGAYYPVDGGYLAH